MALKGSRMKHWTDELVKLIACKEAVEFGEEYRTFQAAWDKCDRGDWMLWFCGKRAGKPESTKRKKLVLAACGCARLALKYTKDPRVLKCIEVAETWARGKATIEELIEARSAAASAAAYAASAAASAAYASASAAYAAYAASDAHAAARQKILKACADIVRKHYPKVPR